MIAKIPKFGLAEYELADFLMEEEPNSSRK